MNSLHLVADENLPGLEQLFAGHGVRLTRLPGAAIDRQALQTADALLVRSVTRVNAQLLQNTPVGFVGTATIGVDHVDQAWLQSQGIAFASAPGCNADSVVDYVISVLLWQAARQDFCLAEQTVGIVGVGQVGSRLAQRLTAWGCRVLLNDPPRSRAGATGMLPLPEVLAQADILCLHTPLTHQGDEATWHLINAESLQPFQGKLVINAGRGAVVDPAVVWQRCRSHPDCAWVLDVFEGEPELDTALIAELAVATPHIAGYSLEGKLRGSAAVYQAWCRWQQQVPRNDWHSCLPEPDLQQLVAGKGLSAQALGQRLALLVYPVWADDQRLRHALTRLSPAQAYQQLRKNYPLRREFSSLQVAVADPVLARAVTALGFGLAEPR